ncbi:MAG: aminotransferase class I/II-fold pyridoxal phosphate-dependent enzyme [Candidatus Poseidoniaceae archaeon]|nr:aminotransferase class I/II-fold pyridoxal phosphate-dependent enzyme [Candidatus Poseidoniaceae archaeon]
MRHYSSSRIDLRSDTVTQPTPAMREAMHTAAVGDDVLGDDPTVKQLEARIATMCGKEAALFVPSGTMANAIALRCHTSPGDEIITAKNSHIYIYEGGGYAALCGASIALVDVHGGLMRPEDVQGAIRKQAGSLSHYPDGTLVCVENTSNRGGGACYPQSTLDEIAAVAKENNCAVHMDGARAFNAAVATNTPLDRMVRDYDSISICLSKGLGAPIGSLLVGSTSFITQAHRWRKMFGGGMRQAGMLAAGGLHALDHHVDRMAEDHARTIRIAKSINELDGFSVDLPTVETNMVYFDSTVDATTIVEALSTAGVDVLDIGPNSCRIVVHLHVTDEDVDAVINIFKSLN